MQDASQSSYSSRENTPWLSQFSRLLTPGSKVLDLGCGNGHDSRDLAAIGCRVIALDFELDRVRKVPADVVELRLVGDITGGLPYQAERFDCVVASLSLHYFTSRDTERSIIDIARILGPGGWLICRVNAVGDTNFGYGEGVEIEPSVFRQAEGHLKRYFDEPMLERFLSPCFRLERIMPRVILQKGLEKRTLECMAQKR